MTEQQPPIPPPGAPEPAQPGAQPVAAGTETGPIPATAPATAPGTPPGPQPAPAAQFAYPYGAPPPGGPYGDPAFLAPPRPRVRWVNPQRRMHVAGAALALALVCGGAGVAIGWASSHHDRGTIGVRLAPGYNGRYLPGPGRIGPNRVPRPAAPVPTPTSTH